ncbi:hypothetical protein BGW36DRAFT_383992 [Talaromyces proteolyticus]|uniref:Carrier domain-containing protein n=1 Tax=Talaromyces proteolyticus TaxID=1131652 RepID=A0AAD4KQL9_9EURO|nr:uncharacterized protein BGW36DRAFT_383992 [Talaromyces proteolyticus]KAH8693929.1 hypothetical protein BGW36DRAFT_383992 [Talaromyces proteolyticus]
MELTYSVSRVSNDKDQILGPQVFHLAWAVTLSQYLSTTSVHFSSIDPDAAEKTPAPEPWYIGLQLENTVAQEYQKFKIKTNGVEQSDQDRSATTGLDRETLLVVGATETDFSVKDYSPIVFGQIKEKSIHVKAKFDPAVITKWLMYRVLRHFAFVIEHILAEPNSKLEKVAIVNPDDVAQLAEWNRTCPAPVRDCVHDIIAKHVETRPDSPAVCSWDGDFTYQQLDELSSRLAVHLQSLGVGPEVFVPLIFEKSKWNIVGTLGVIKAGGIFTPLDPKHPVKRLQDICQQTKAKVIVTSNQYKSLASALTENANVVAVGEWESAWCHNPGDYVSSSVSPDNGLYSIFTSGTTGKPKGVVIEHLTWCSGIGPMMDRMGLSHESRAYQFSSHAFDVSVSDILATLCAGACICIPSDLERTSNLVESANRMKVTICTMTPSVARLFRPADVPTLKRMVFCGELMTPSDLEIWRPVLRNLYGPVETTVFCTGQVGLIPTHRNIGYAFGSVFWVVDRNDHRKLAPIGSVGEILIEGPMVARGYLNDPEKTANSFVEPPEWIRQFRKDGGFRRYLTGDLARYNEDGTLEFQARKDTQVKYHGQRIELAEVAKHTHTSFEDAQDVVVDMVSLQARGGHDVLVTFVLLSSLKDEASETFILPASTTFRQKCLSAETKLREFVPSYMIPSVYIPVSRMPLTSNGKIDRRVLKEVALGLSSGQLDSYTTAIPSQLAEPSFRQPVTEKEKTFQKLVAEALNQDFKSIGMDDSFFHVGGDSTTAMKLVVLSRQANIHFTVPDLITRPKLSELLAWTEKQNLESNGTGIPNAAIVRSKPQPFSILGVTDPETFFKDTLAPQIRSLSFDDVLDVFPMTDMQNRFYGPCIYHQLYLNGSVDKERLRSACEQLVEERAILRAIFASYKDSLIQVIPKKSFKISFVEDECETDLAEYVGGFCQTDVATSLQVGVPPVKFILVSKSETEHCLILRITHAQYDGVTLPILYRRIASLYNGHVGSVTTDYPDYLYSTWAQKGPASFEIWKNVLQDSSMTYVGTQADMKDAQPALLYGARALPVLQPPLGFTLATVVKAAWALTLSEHAKTYDIAFGQMVNGRGLNLPGIEDVLGPCFNTIPVRIALQPTWTGLELLRYVQNQHLQTMPVSSIGFEDIKTNSTSWDAATPSATNVVHQHFEHLEELSIDERLQCTIKEFFVPQVPQEVVLYSEPKETHWELALVTSAPVMDAQAFDGLLGTAADNIQSLIAQPNKLLADYGSEASN